MPTVLLCMTAPDDQVRAFGEAARRAGVTLRLVSDRSDTVEGPWSDGAIAARFGLDLPGEEGDWLPSPAKLTLANVSETDLEECASRARAHYVLLCASVV